MITYTKTSPNDSQYLADSLVKLCEYIKNNGSDLYSGNLPTVMNDDLRSYAGEHIDVKGAFSFIAKDGDKNVGCCYGKIQASELPVCYQKPVGFISVLWVEQEYARKGVGSKLLEMVEKHLKENGVEVMELSYMCVNEAAQAFWDKQGFAAFRTFAYKNLV